MTKALLLSILLFGLLSNNSLAVEGIFSAAESHEESLLNPPFPATRVKFAASLVRVDEIQAASEEEPMLTATFNLEISWPDPRLVSKGPDAHAIHVFQNEEATQVLGRIFNPNISVVDGKMELLHQHLRIFPDGKVRLEQNVEVSIPANFNLLRFPFDDQAFMIRFASLFWDANEVDLVQEIASADRIEEENDAWHINYRSFYVVKKELRKRHDKVSTFHFIIYAERNPNYFIWRLLVPLMVIVFLSWNVFWLHEDKALALGNCFLFLLTVVTFHDTVRSMLPVLSYFTFMDAIVFISYAFIIIPTIQVISAIRMEDDNNHDKMNRIRRNCKWIIPVLYLLTISATTLRYFLM